jgi:hypothetical protein
VFSAVGFNCFVEPAKNRLPLEPTTTVISTEAAHAFVSSEVEKSASLPPFPGQQHVPAFVLAVACSFVGIQQGPAVVLSVVSEAIGKIELFQLPRKAFHTAPNAAQSLKGM